MPAPRRGRSSREVVAQRTGVPVEAITIEDGTFHGPAGPIGSYWEMADQAPAGDRGDARGRGRNRPARGASPAPRSPASTCRTRSSARPATCTTCGCRGCCRPGWCGRPARRACWPALRDGPLPGDARVVRDGSFLAVLAATEWDAEAAATRVAGARSWDGGTRCRTGLLADWLRDAATARRAQRRGAQAAGAAPPRTLARSFFRPYLAHASIAPSCASRAGRAIRSRSGPTARAPTTCAPTSPRRCAAPRRRSSSATAKAPAATAITAPTTWRWTPCWSPARCPACRCACSGRAPRNSAGRPSPRPCWWMSRPISTPPATSPPGAATSSATAIPRGPGRAPEPTLLAGRACWPSPSR